MKKMVCTLVSLCFSIVTMAQNDDWQPVSRWPFVYEHFKSATISLTSGGKDLRVMANIHVGNNALWYESMGKRLQANSSTINTVTFVGGAKYYNVEGKMCRLLSEDSIAGKIGRLYLVEQVDKHTYDEMVKINRQSSMMVTDISPVFQNVASGVADNEGVRNIEEEPLPMQNKFYMLYNDEIFEVTEGNILKHLGSKEERNAYRAFTRKAEIRYGNVESVQTVWNTFFVK